VQCTGTFLTLLWVYLFFCFYISFKRKNVNLGTFLTNNFMEATVTTATGKNGEAAMSQWGCKLMMWFYRIRRFNVL
jgi:hypothetical protein